MEAVEYLTILRRRWLLILAVVATGLVAALVIGPAKDAPAEYRGTHTLLLRATSGDAAGGAARTDRGALSSTASLVTSNEVATRVASALGFAGDPTRLTRTITVEPDPEASTIKISSTQSSGERAAALANTFAGELRNYLDQTSEASRQQALAANNQKIEQLRAQLRQVEVRIVAAPIGQAGAFEAERDALVRQLADSYQRSEQLSGQGLPSANLITVQQARPARVSGGFGPPESRLGRLGFAGGLGLVLGAGFALVVDRMDTRIRTKEHAEAAFGAPVLAEIPVLPIGSRHRNEVLTATRSNSLGAEAFRALRTSLLLMNVGSPKARSNGAGAGADDHPPAVQAGDPHLQVILVTSANPGEGKTTTAANLAASLAEAGRRVLVVDCDFRHPRIQRFLQVADGPGLSDVLVGGPNAPRLRDVAVRTPIPDVGIVTSGNYVDNPAELFSQGGHTFLSEARQIADMVILDTPPILAINDATELVPYTDGVVVVCRGGRTTVSSARRTGELLRRLGAPLRGVVLMAAAEAPSSRGYYYYYYRSEQNRGRLGWRRLFRRHRPTQPKKFRPARPRNAPAKHSARAAKAKQPQRRPTPAPVGAQRPAAQRPSSPTPPAASSPAQQPQPAPPSSAAGRPGHAPQPPPVAPPSAPRNEVAGSPPQAPARADPDAVRLTIHRFDDPEDAHLDAPDLLSPPGEAPRSASGGD